MDFKYDNLEISKLDSLCDLTKFDCLRTKEEFPGTKSKQRKKFKKHSQNINHFLVNEALQEQNQGLNTTSLLYYKNILIGYISLCADSIRLNTEEKEKDGITYFTVPALKIARLGIHKDYQGHGLGRFLIEFAISKAIELRAFAGVKFITVDCYKHRISYYEKCKFIVNKIQKENREPDNPISLRLNIDKYLEEYDQ